MCTVILFTLFLISMQAHAGRFFFVSSSKGSDDNNGSREYPFQTLQKISSIELQAGDTVFFMYGDRFDGHFVVNGSGSTEAPIVITAFGEGEKPILSGEVGSEEGGDYQEAIYVLNHDNIVFEGLEIQNERTVSRAGIDDVDAYGIYIHNNGTRVLRNFVFRNMTFRNVYAVKEMNNPDDFNKLEVAGVRIESAKNTISGQEKHIRDVLVEDCYFTDLQRLGVHMKHFGASSGLGNDSINRNMNLVFRNNEFHYLGGTCILPSRTYNCLIENNLFNHPGAKTDPRMPGRGSAVWNWRSVNTVIQYNHCLHIRGYLDSHGIHIDHENEYTFIQYNFMKDCEGGFVEILGGNLNAVYRFNISVNDGWRNNPNWVNSNHTFWLNDKVSGNQIHHSDETYIYNNTLYIDSAYSTAISINAKNTYIYNNIIVALNGANIGGKQVVLKSNGAELLISNNLYFGTVAKGFKDQDKHVVNGTPNFKDATSYTPEGFQLNTPSFAINAGLAKQGPAFPNAGQGIFNEIPTYVTSDFFGNPADLSAGTPNIGACNSKDGGVGIHYDKGTARLNQGCYVYPNPVSSSMILELQGRSIGSLDLRIFDTKGRIVQVISDVRSIDGQLFSLELDPYINDGIYFLIADSGSEKVSSRFILDRE